MNKYKINMNILIIIIIIGKNINKIMNNKYMNTRKKIKYI